MKDELLEKHDDYCTLFDFYEKLFTEKQIEYFKEYYYFDYSLSEIAQNHNISRSAVFDVIKKMHAMLDDYENKLSLYKKSIELHQVCDEYTQKGKNENNTLLLEFLDKIREE